MNFKNAVDSINVMVSGSEQATMKSNAVFLGSSALIGYAANRMAKDPSKKAFFTTVGIGVGLGLGIFLNKVIK